MLQKWFCMVVNMNNPLSRGLSNIAEAYLIEFGQSTCSELKNYTNFVRYFTVELPTSKVFTLFTGVIQMSNKIHQLCTHIRQVINYNYIAFALLLLSNTYTIVKSKMIGHRNINTGATLLLRTIIR